ncbi:hypothetical protein BDN72DRAFT_193469 [Pluteus cervinus]|uniref:Uncharacterized protein n=1 Tax=Pluteus cervinus TaxID=181527 RepID=A0ACD3AKV9_9AGAR|nr:hypothetical protein BDN72DRAFT_193469 [Pluteus cervinus]
MKVHRSRLVAHSKWFKALFEEQGAFPQAVNGEIDTFQLAGTGVSLTDFEAVLTASEDGFYCYAKPSLAFVASLVRAASVFQFEKLLEYATHFLEEVFPSDVGKVSKLPIPIADATEAILLGRNWDLPQLLKRAFYELARAPPSETPIPKESRYATMLEKDDLLLVNNLQKYLTAAWHRILMSFPKAECNPDCTTTRKGFSYNSPVVQNHHFDPIWGLTQLRTMDWRPSWMEFKFSSWM